MSRHEYPTPVHAWTQHDGSIRLTGADHPGGGTTVRPGDEGYENAVAQAWTWTEFLKDHNTTGSPRVLQRAASNPSGPFLVVGTVELTREREFTQYGGYAAYWTTITAQPQTVELTSNGYHAMYRFEGIVTSGGINVGDRPGDTHIGDVITVGVQPYCYEVDDCLASDQTGEAVIYRVTV